MNPIDFADLAIKLYGRKRWKRELAKALGTNASTIHRLGQREEIPGVYEVALKGLLQHKRAQHILDRDARAKERKLHPKPRKRVLIPPHKEKTADGLPDRSPLTRTPI